MTLLLGKVVKRMGNSVMVEVGWFIMCWQMSMCLLVKQRRNVQYLASLTITIESTAHFLIYIFTN